MIKIAVLDDEKIMADEITRLIAQCLSVDNEIVTYTDAAQFNLKLSCCNYDMIFLDIELPGINGFELAEKIQMNHKRIEIFFVSSHEEMILNSIDYFPKGFIRKRHLKEDLKDRIDNWLKYYSQNSVVKFMVADIGELCVYDDEIVYFESFKHELYICDKSYQKHRLMRYMNIYDSLKRIKMDYGKIGFIQINKSVLLNFRYILSIEKDHVILKNKEVIYVNPKKVSEIKSEYSSWMMEIML